MPVHTPPCRVVYACGVRARCVGVRFPGHPPGPTGLGWVGTVTSASLPGEHSRLSSTCGGALLLRGLATLLSLRNFKLSPSSWRGEQGRDGFTLMKVAAEAVTWLGVGTQQPQILLPNPPGTTCAAIRDGRRPLGEEGRRRGGRSQGVNSVAVLALEWHSTPLGCGGIGRIPKSSAFSFFPEAG